MNLREVWQQLEEDVRLSDTSGRVQRRIEPTGRWNFFLGLEMPLRRRMLIMRVSTASISGSSDVPDTRGLAVRITGRGPESHETEIELILMDAIHREIFDRLIEDLVEVTRETQDEYSGVRRFLERLSNWQQLLRMLVLGGLSRKGQQGLWGELWVLREEVAPIVGFIGSVRGWRGPLGDNQDFQMGNVAIEVKTSVDLSFDRMVIASERQLEVPEDVALVIVALSLDVRVGHGETLPDLVANLRQIASGEGCLHMLNDKLETSGYLNEDTHLYADPGYMVRESAMFGVSEGFPRITSAGSPVRSEPGQLFDFHGRLCLLPDRWSAIEGVV